MTNFELMKAAFAAGEMHCENGIRENPTRVAELAGYKKGTAKYKIFLCGYTVGYEMKEAA